MEEFKKKLQSRQLLLTSGLLFACCAIIFSNRFAQASAFKESTQDFIDGFQMGIVTAILGALVFFIVRNIYASRSPDRLRKRYIAETDERKLFIRQKSGSIGMDITLYGLAVGAAVAGNLNAMVFFTLLGACLFVSSVRGFLKLYYRIKY